MSERRSEGDRVTAPDPVTGPVVAPEAPAPDPANLVCPAPIPERARVLLGHGSGGQLSAALMREVIGPALGSAAAVGADGAETAGQVGPLNDAAVVEVAGQRLAFTTDSFVVSPLEFSRSPCPWPMSSKRGCRSTSCARSPNRSLGRQVGRACGS
jgi:hypothetical protein